MKGVVATIVSWLTRSASSTLDLVHPCDLLALCQKTLAVQELIVRRREYPTANVSTIQLYFDVITFCLLIYNLTRDNSSHVTFPSHIF